MPPGRVSPPSDPVEAVVQRLLSTAIRDLEGGADPSDAGWLKLSLEDLARAKRGLAIPGVLESRSGQRARMVLRSVPPCADLKGVYPRLSRQLEYLLDANEQAPKDRRALTKAGELLQRVSSHLGKSPNDWGVVSLVGWLKMIETRGFEVPPKLVLDAEFSPKSWTIASFRASAQLAREVVESSKLTPTPQALERLRRLTGASDGWETGEAGITPEEFERVRRVLGWAEFSAAVPPAVVRSLGFAWFVKTVWEGTGTLPADSRQRANLSQSLDRATVGLTRISQAGLYELVQKLLTQGHRWCATVLDWPELGE